jgi:putative ABC transport system permease protein
MGVLNRSVKSIWRRKWRTFAALLAVAVAMAIMVAIPAGLSASQSAVQSSQDRLEQSIDSMQASYENATTLITVSFGNFRGGFGNPNATSTVTYVTSDELAEIEALDNVTSVVAYIEKTAGLPTQNTTFTPGQPGSRPTMDFSSMYVVKGIPTEEGTIDGLTPTISEGSWISEGSLTEIVLSQSLADQWGVGVGDTYSLEGVSVTVVGIVEDSTSTSSFSSRVVYTSLELAQQIYGLDDSYTNLYIYAADADVVEEVALEVESVVTEAQVSTNTDRLTQLEQSQTQLTSTLASANATLAQTQATATQEIIITLAASGAIILLIMLFNVRERVREIGVMKTLGFSNRDVVSQLVLEGLVITAIGCIVGIAIGYIAYPTLANLVLPASTSQSPSSGMGGAPGQMTQVATQALVATPDMGMVMLAFGAVLLVGVLGTLYPAWKASRVKPVEALRNE